MPALLVSLESLSGSFLGLDPGCVLGTPGVAGLTEWVSVGVAAFAHPEGMSVPYLFGHRDDLFWY